MTVLGPNQNARPGVALPAGTTDASIVTARNEFESFQIVVEADAQIDDLRVDLPGSLTLVGDSGTTLPAAAFTFYREGYATVVSNQDIDTRSDGEGAAGQWPDVLIPQRDYIYNENRSAFNAPVPAGGRVAIWVDVLTPLGQTAGSYQGAVRIKDGTDVLKSVDVGVEVRDIDLPSTSTLDNQFATRWDRPCKAHTGHDQCNWDPDQVWLLHALYARVALENRVTISNPWPISKEQTLENNSHGVNFTGRFQKYLLPLIKGTATDASLGSQPRLPGAALTSLALQGPAAGATVRCETACVNSWKARAAADGFQDLLTYYTCDEPFFSTERWNACNATHNEVSGPSGLPELVTTAISEAKAAGQGNGADSWIDVMVPLTRQMSNKPSSPYLPGNQRATYNAWLAAQTDAIDNELWIYSACDSAGCNGRDSADQDPPWNAPYWDGWAGYGIDQPPSQARAMSWLAFEYGASGELYWHTTEKLHQAWNDCTTVTDGKQSNCLYDSGMMGDGTLFYPGKPCAPTPADRACIGGTKHIPLESIRLKRIRDGREDYELLHQLDERSTADGDFARTTALELFGPDLDKATYSATAAIGQGDIDNARLALLDQLAPVVDPGPSLSISDATVTEGTGDDVIMTFTVTGTGDTNGWVEIKSEDGTATGADYELLTGSLEMHTPETREVEVLITGDDLDEDTETFEVILWNATNYTLADAVGVGTILDDDTAAPTYRPDSLIKAGDRFIGDGVYSLDARDQTVKRTVRRKKSVSAVWRVQNDGDAPDSYSLVGSPSFPGFITEYYKGKKRITEDVVDGNYSTGVIAAGDQRTYRIVVKATKRADRGDWGKWTMHAVSYQAQLQGDNVRDVTALRLKVK